MSILGLSSPNNQSEYDTEEQKTTNTIGAIVFFLLLGAGIIVGGIVFYSLHSANRTHEWLGQNGIRGSAKCVESIYGKSFCTKYEFTVGKFTYRGSGSAKYPQPAESEDVLYDPADPNIHRLVSDQAPYDLRTMYFSLGATLVIGLLAKLLIEPLVSMIMVKKT